MSCFVAWKHGTVEHPASVFVHCNGGVKIAVAAIAFLASKFHNSNLFDEARELLRYRFNNETFKPGIAPTRTD